MPPKRDLSQEQVQEIRSLRGQLPAVEAKKRFGIGSTRLYKIWRDGSGDPEIAPANPVLAAEDGPLPTVADFYNRLGRLESRVEQATDLLVQVLAQLSNDDDLLEDLVAEQQQEIAEQATQTRMDLQIVESTQRWIYIAAAAVLAWKVAAKTWGRRTPTAAEPTTAPTTTAAEPRPTIVPTRYSRGHPFHME